MIRALIFDLDGTLVQTERLKALSYAGAAIELCPHQLSEGQVLVSDGAWGMAAGTARLWFARSPRRLERLGAAGGAMMIALGLHLAVTGRND